LKKAKLLKKAMAFTLMELMIVVAIMGVVAVIGGISISSRIKSSRLETAAMSLAADLAYARSAALFKGCHTRIILCLDSKCGTKTANPPVARYYAILRRAQYSNSAESCYGGVTGPTDGYADWDFDKPPRPLPSGVKLYRPSGFYNFASTISHANWSDIGSDEASRSLYFHSSPYAINAIHIPLRASVVPMADSNRGRPVFQMGLDDCAPGASGCTGYIISISEAGETFVTVCPGAIGGVQACY